MPAFGPIKRKNLIMYLRQLGFDGPYSGKKHQFMLLGVRRLILPNPHPDDISKDLVANILRQAGITRDEWEQL